MARESRGRKAAPGWFVALIATFLMVSAFVLAPRPADASDSEHHMWSKDATPHGGWMGFTEHGDQVGVCDTDADGRRAMLYVYAYGYFRYKIQANGDGTCTVVDYSYGSEYNLPENEYITFDLWLFDYDGEDGGSCCNHLEAWYNDH